jgi:trimeric autotransporter adhesin
MHRHSSRNKFHPVRTWLRTAAALLIAAGAAACTDQALLSPEGPRLDEITGPPITVTPGTAFVGDTGVVLTVRGSGFTEYAYVEIDPWINAMWTFVDDSTFSVHTFGPLQQAGAHQVRVMSETGEWSAPDTFSVVNPVPVIERVTPDFCDTGSACGPITVHGRNFMQGAIVLWNDSYVYSQRQSDSVMVVYPDPYDLQDPGLAQLQAHNPEPGGGTSQPVLFQVGMRIMMHTNGARAGGAGFELEIYGESFSGGATVYWNGSPRQTYVSNARRISAYIPASDVAVPGEGVITLSTWQLNQGQPFRIGTITVRAPQPASVTSQHTLALPVRDLAYSEFTQRLYGTVYSGPNAGNLAVIDPQTGTVEGFVWIGWDPRYVALSDDGKYLWVGVDGENAVRRVNLEYGWPDVAVYLDPFVAEDLAALPGEPLAVAVARKNPSDPDEPGGVAVYEGYWGSMRPSTTTKEQGSDLVELGARGSTLFSLGTGSGDNRYRTLAVDGNGVTVTATGWNLDTSPAADFVFAGGRLYTSDGHTIDTGYNDWAGFFNINNTGGAVRPDTRTGQAYFLNGSGIRVADINTFATVATLPVPPLQFESWNELRRHLVRWGTDGLAFHDADQVFILRSPIVGP